MDLSRAAKYIKDAFDGMGISMEYDLTEKRFYAKGNLYKEGLGDFLFTVAVYSGNSNTASCSMFFDELPATPKVYQLLNEFNKNAYLLHACEDEYLILENTACRINEEDIAQYVLDILDELNDDEVLSLLTPLINETR